MIANLMMVAGVGIFLLLTLELMLSAPQKTALSNWTTGAWFYLDGYRARFMKQPFVRYIIAISVCAFFCALVIIYVMRFVSDFQFYYSLFRWLFGYAASGELSEAWWSAVYLFKTFALILLIALSPILLLYAALFLLAGFELVMRRLAEYPKGPVIAISVALGSVAGLLKALQ